MHHFAQREYIWQNLKQQFTQKYNYVFTYPHVILNLYDYLFLGAQKKMHLGTKIVETVIGTTWRLIYFWMNHPLKLVLNEQ